MNSRHQRYRPLPMARTLVMLAALAVVAAGCDATSAPTSSIDPATMAPAPDRPQLATVQTGTVVEAIDGDSLLVDTGAEQVEVRLLGINTPEREECGAETATGTLASLAEGAEVTLSWDELDRFGRALGYVDTGVDLAAALVETGQALALSDDHPRFADYAAAERAALAAGVGMWSVRCEPSSSAQVRIAALTFDPPGPDGDDRNGEVVGLRNDGNDSVDLTGWVLRDESSRWRFAFPTGFTLAGQSGVLVRTGCGDDSAEDLFWCATDPVWNNGGDTALLLDSGGNVVDRWLYGPKA